MWSTIFPLWRACWPGTSTQSWTHIWKYCTNKDFLQGSLILCAAILAKGFSIQLKRGLNREYIEKSDALSAIRGRIEIAESLKTRSTLKKRTYRRRGTKYWFVLGTNSIPLRSQPSGILLWPGSIFPTGWGKQSNCRILYDQRNRTKRRIYAKCEGSV